MRLLLDTHAFLWFVDDNPRLSAHAKALLESDADLSLSLASLWEIAIKTSIGKLTLAHPFDLFISRQLPANGIELLNITTAHLARLTTLPFHHRDPFDRLLVAQALTENLTIVSVDAALDNYGVTRLW